MAESEKPTTGPPESPTTARELDFDDEGHETSAPATPAKNTSTPPAPTVTAQEEERPPPQPPRPLSPRQQAENTLKEAFPSIDASVVKAVLTASGGNVEPAFHALLGMSDPNAQEPAPPPQPPRPAQAAQAAPTSTAQSQVEADEQYARRLAEHYSGGGSARRSGSRGARQGPEHRQRKESGLKPNELYDDREHSFFDDDLPVIREQFKKGFQETQTKALSFINNLKKRIDGDEEDDFQSPPPRQATGYNAGPPQQQYARRSGDVGRRSADHDRYDADPQVLGDDFAVLQMRDETTPQRRSTRPLANPDLFKPTLAVPQGGRRVSFQDGPPEDIDETYRSSPDPAKRSASATGRGKWQPLAAVDPSPVADHDPFSLGDSDDEESKKKDLKEDDSERLKKAAAEAMSEDIGPKGTKKLEPQETTGESGTRDQEAEAMLTSKP